MEHEVFVPVPAEVLRATLTDPARIARCVPGFQQDADAATGPLSGRLKIRVGGNTITYRGTFRIAERDGGAGFAVEGEGTEVRGKGTASLALALTLTPLAEGTTIGFTGEVTAAGRLAEADADARGAVGARLLDRFAEALVAVADVEAEMAVESEGKGNGQDEDEDEDGDGVEDADEAAERDARTSVFDTPVPPPSLDALADEEYEAPGTGQPAEAAHARRTMIGRSAEEVDHAPPRGRYAPVPAVETSGAGASLRWIAPAAALALASAVVVSRALRRRR
ncbi:SRPBCC family protein [Streptomyces sp. NPDC003943]